MSDPANSKGLGSSFSAAFRGLFLVIRTERNVRIHLFAALLVTTAGFIFGISKTDWIIILLLFAMVITAEMINTAIEKLADVAEPGFSNKVRDLKDISAGAVLWMSMVSIIIGIIIFAPEFLEFIRFNLNQ
ncbi:MAG: diacylglycerol kinase family protein [Bacteroidales bacterium]|nr:diacylglycerol kinase family protein [Bacteroidales bacterium]